MNHDVVKPYDATEDKKVQVTNMFDRIAPYYDFLNRLLTLRIDVLWRKKAINMVAASQPKVILDVATGTGDLALEMYKRLNPTKIIGMDISPNMLEIAKKKVDSKDWSNQISMELGDSENLTYNDEYFDLTTSSFGVRNFADLKKGLSEMYRVTKKGGSIMVLEFSRPRMFPIKNLYNIYFKYALPVIGRLTSKDPRAYKYLYESVQAFPDNEDFTGLLEEIGFHSATYKSLSFGICNIYLAKK